MGATDQQLADFLEIDHATLNRWKKKHPAFRDSLKGKLEADAKVVASLYKRAIGFKTKEITYEKTESRGLPSPGDNEGYTKRIVVKEVPPDVTAQIFWLKNRQRDNWKSYHPTEISIGDSELPVSITLHLGHGSTPPGQIEDGWNHGQIQPEP